MDSSTSTAGKRGLPAFMKKMYQKPPPQQHQRPAISTTGNNLVTLPTLVKNITVPQPATIQGINKIQYCVIPEMPNLMPHIQQCPIKFNHLPFSGRYVKQIDILKTNEDQPVGQYISYLFEILKNYLHDPNHILINDYPACTGIMAHTDGPLYYPNVVVLSFGTAIIQFIKEHGDPNPKKLFLEDRSLHIFSEAAYTDYMHGIKDYGVDAIFVKLQFDKETKKPTEIVRCSVLNLQFTRVYQQIKEQLIEGKKYLELEGGVEVSSIEGNEEYNYKIEILRKRRISLTIRHKYHE